MRLRHPAILATLALAAAVVVEAQELPAEHIELIKPMSCSATIELYQPDPVICTVWAVAATSGSISGAKATCSNPQFAPLARKCLNAHRLKEQFSGHQQPICAEITFKYGAITKAGGAHSTSVKELAPCPPTFKAPGTG